MAKWYKSRKAEIVGRMHQLYDDTVRVEQEPSGSSLKGENFNIYERNSEGRFELVGQEQSLEEALEVAYRR